MTSDRNPSTDIPQQDGTKQETQAIGNRHTGSTRTRQMSRMVVVSVDGIADALVSLAAESAAIRIRAGVIAQLTAMRETDDVCARSTALDWCNERATFHRTD